MRKNVVLFAVVSLVFLLFPLTFVLGALEAPTPLYPTASDSPVWKGKIEFLWNATGAPFYRYFIDLPDGSAKTAVTPSFLVTIHELEPGTYRWRVSACNDGQGTSCGSWSEDEAFEIVLAPAEFSGGLIPCGKEVDDASTPGYNESNPCGIPHIFLLLKNLLDFTLWRLGPLIIVLMAVATGAVSYFSFGGSGIFIKIKTVWKSLFVGYLIALFAWFGVNLVLNLLGFQTKIFGQWWQFPF